ncbi:MAG: hypothetical protein O2807_06905 [bacterium]|nr:hypothetical protein [bacterium]
MRTKEKSLRLFLEEIAREAGALALSHFGKAKVEKKGDSIVSEADRAVERLLIGRIRAHYPGDYILAEESGAIGEARPGPGTRWWAIDPIDGTGPFLSALPFWSVSVACLRGAAVEAAAVFLPVGDEMYSAEAGGQAFKDGAPLPPLSKDAAHDHSFLFVPGRPVSGLHIDFPGPCLSLSAASVHLTYTASGAAFGTVVEPTHAYDIAAAALVLECVGGRVISADGAPLNYARLADGRRSEGPVVAAAAGRIDELLKKVSWKEA